MPGKRYRLPERAIDYRGKYLAHLSDEDFMHVSKIISIAALEGECGALQGAIMITSVVSTKEYRAAISEQCKDSNQQLKDMCILLKVHYNEGSNT